MAEPWGHPHLALGGPQSCTLGAASPAAGSSVQRGLAHQTSQLQGTAPMMAGGDSVTCMSRLMHVKVPGPAGSATAAASSETSPFPGPRPAPAAARTLKHAGPASPGLQSALTAVGSGSEGERLALSLSLPVPAQPGHLHKHPRSSRAWEGVQGPESRWGQARLRSALGVR